MSDVLLYQSTDDGEIVVENGVMRMTSGYETACYLALFGGNDDDDGIEGNPATWWGNAGENEPERHMVSQTQNILRRLPVSSGSLRQVENAVKNDLAFFPNVQVSTAIVGLNKIKITIILTFDTDIFTVEFIENWKSEQ